MPFSFSTGGIPGLVIVSAQVFSDRRGYFLETYRQSEFAAAGVPDSFVQDNHSCSDRGVLRGLHFQREPYAQGKLVRVTRGAAWDVAVDMRPGSPTFGKWAALELTAENRLIYYIPPGFAHGFLALEDGTEFQYKCTVEYNPEADAGIRWNDPDIGIKWPLKNVLVSPKDAKLPYLKDLA